LRVSCPLAIASRIGPDFSSLKIARCSIPRLTTWYQPPCASIRVGRATNRSLFSALLKSSTCCMLRRDPRQTSLLSIRETWRLVSRIRKSKRIIARRFAVHRSLLAVRWFGVRSLRFWTLISGDRPVDLFPVPTKTVRLRGNRPVTSVSHKING
jgi:hypothetical protein